MRVNLFEALRLRQKASVAELAVDLEKSVHSLYYHVKSLTKVGLIRVCDYRRVGKRDEAIYESVSDRLVFNKESTNPAYTESLIKTIRLALRKAEREHQDARRATVSSELFAILRLQANLSSDDAQALRKKVAAIGKWVRNRDLSDTESDTTPIAITCLVVPLEPLPIDANN